MRWAIWWFAVLCAYVIEFVTQTLSEVAAGAIIAALCVPLVAIPLREGLPGVRVRWRWLRNLAHVPAAMVRDLFLVSGRVLWVLRTGNQLTGMLTRVRYDCGDRENDLNMGREALVIFGVCAAPNTVVAEVDLRGELVVHQLIAREQHYRSEQWPL